MHPHSIAPRTSSLYLLPPFSQAMQQRLISLVAELCHLSPAETAAVLMPQPAAAAPASSTGSASSTKQSTAGSSRNPLSRFSVRWDALVASAIGRDLVEECNLYKIRVCCLLCSLRGRFSFSLSRLLCRLRSPPHRFQPVPYNLIPKINLIW